ncbi:MAG TPA: HIT family protein [Micavibrio sp.]|nr:HIT family protein [Micavibrio sp.]
MDQCAFCEIVKGHAPSSKIYEDDLVIAILDIRQIRPGHCMVIPKIHIDRFTDLDDALAGHMCRIGNKIGRKIQKELNPVRIGFAVAGFGVAHAHYHVVPMHEPFDITSSRYAIIKNGIVSYETEHIPLSDPDVNKRLVELLRL